LDTRVLRAVSLLLGIDHLLLHKQKESEQKMHYFLRPKRGPIVTSLPKSGGNGSRGLFHGWSAVVISDPSRMILPWTGPPPQKHCFSRPVIANLDWSLPVNCYVCRSPPASVCV